VKKHFLLTLFAIFIVGCSFLSLPFAAAQTPAHTTTEAAEALDSNPLFGVWKTDDMRAPDNSWKTSYSMYIQFTDTKQYVYHGVDTFNSNRPSDVSEIVYFNLNDSTFIKKMIDTPDHPEYLGKFEKWTWRFDNENVLFTVYGMMDSQDLALNNNTIAALATGIKVQQSQTEIPASIPPGGANSIAAGDWTAVADLGKIVFTVDQTGTKITKVSYQFADWKCGPTSQSGTIEVGPAEWAITNGQFSITTNLDPINNTQTIQFEGTYDAASQKFSGTWNGVSYGTPCSGTWEASAPR
jgi:hypothetical protein